MEAVVDRVRALPWRDVEKPALVMAWLAGGLLATQAVIVYAQHGWIGKDSHAYWAAVHRPELYSVPPGGVDAFNYSPAFAQAIWPLAQMPWPAFCVLWAAFEVAAFVWLFRPLGLRWAVPLTLLCASEWTIGNVTPFLAVAAVLGMRSVQSERWDLSSGWWAAVALAKPTMALGPVWFAARGEWRKVAVSAAVTGAVVAVSYVVWPSAWPDWWAFLTTNAGDQADRHIALRLPVVLVLTVWAARRDARWLLLVAMTVASPVWAGAQSLTLLAGLPRLIAAGGRPSPGTPLARTLRRPSTSRWPPRPRRRSPLRRTGTSTRW